jgi:hypothetical protein
MQKYVISNLSIACLVLETHISVSLRDATTSHGINRSMMTSHD